MVHSIHPASLTHGLADDCERCAEHAQHPLSSLDNANAHMLVERVRKGEIARSDNEGIAMAYIEQAMFNARRLMELGVIPGYGVLG